MKEREQASQQQGAEQPGGHWNGKAANNGVDDTSSAPAAPLVVNGSVRRSHPRPVTQELQKEFRSLFREIRRSLEDPATEADASRKTGSPLPYSPATEEFRRFQNEMARNISQLIERDRRGLSPHEREVKLRALKRKLQRLVEALAANERMRLGLEEPPPELMLPQALEKRRKLLLADILHTNAETRRLLKPSR